MRIMGPGKKAKAQEEGGSAQSHGDPSPGADLAPLLPLLSLVPCAPQRWMAGK